MEVAMKVMLLHGSPRKESCTRVALDEIAGTLQSCGVDSELVSIGTKAIRGCIACRKCVETGRCVFNDDPINEWIDVLKECDGLIVASPVYYSSPNPTVCAALDRMFYGNSAHFALKPGAAIVSCRRAGSTSALDILQKYFTIAQMPIVSSQYWNMVHGNTPDEVRQDLEGLQTMRVLAKNMAWLLKCIEAGKNSVALPEREQKIATNFIR